MTSSPPSSTLRRQSRESPRLYTVGNTRRGLRSLWHLSLHLTARADDNHAAPRRPHRIKPHVPPLVRAPVNSFEFQPCGRTPQVDGLTLSLGRGRSIAPAAGHHRLRRGLPGYLILFDPHAFAPQRRSRAREVPPQSAFCVISMHFTATPRIPPTAHGSQPDSINGTSRVGPADFTADLTGRLRAL